MEFYQMGAVETKFAQIIWEHEPVRSTELVALAAKELNWKKSTTFTVLRRLCEKGIVQNVNSIVTSVMSPEQYATAQSMQFVKDTFDDSLPAFLAAFSAGRKLSSKEVEELRHLIEEQ